MMGPTAQHETTLDADDARPRSRHRLLGIDVDRLLQRATRRTGLTDFGDASFREPLDRLAASIDNEANLTMLGRLAARAEIAGLLDNRLLLERDRRLHPGIAAERIRRPLVITGLPRTGSTFLHGLLAQDPANRVPLHWELRYPSPPPEPGTRDVERRIARAARQLRWFARLAPEFRKIHPVGARLPEECIIALSHSFLSFEFSSNWYVPAYQDWLEQQDLTPAYAWHRRVLQQLQWRRPGQRWLLKAPPHLPGMAALCATYPDVDVIVTHRDPLEVVPSVASLHVVLRRTFARDVDPHAVGPEVSRMLADDIRRGFAARDGGCAPPEQFLDVWYSQIMEDPFAVVRRIYRHFDLPLSDATLERMRRYVATHPKDRHGTHVYTLAQFGLDAGVERRRYGEYWERWRTPIDG